MPSSSSTTSSSSSSRTIDIFGRQSSNWNRGQRGPRGLQGPRGLRGPPGIGSIENIVRWFPNMVVNETRYNEFCCLKIDDPRTDLLVEKETKVIKRWNSTTSKSNNYAECLQEYFSKTYRLVNARKRIYALDVDGENVYRIRHVTLFPYRTNTWIWACITFRCSKKEEESEQYLFSNYDDEKSGDPNEFRGVSIGADQKSIKIWGAAAATTTSGGVTNHQRFVNVDVTNIPGVDSLLDKWCTVYVFWSDLELAEEEEEEEEATTTTTTTASTPGVYDGKEGSYVVVVQEEEEEEQKRIEGRFTCQECTTFWVPTFIDLFGVTRTTSSSSTKEEDENNDNVVVVGEGKRKKKKNNVDVGRKIIHHGFRGEVAFFELYIQNDVKTKEEATTGYPEILRDLVIRNQSIY